MYYDEVNDVFVGRVLRRMGNGRMEVFCTDTREDEVEGKRYVDKTVVAPLRGSMRGRGKKSVWVEPGSLVMVLDTGLGGAMSHEIVGVFNAEQVNKLRKTRPDLNPQLFVKGEGEAVDEGGVVFDASEDEGEVNVDDI
jgi:translation initiation factor IF-1